MTNELPRLPDAVKAALPPVCTGSGQAPRTIDNLKTGVYRGRASGKCPRCRTRFGLTGGVLPRHRQDTAR